MTRKRLSIFIAIVAIFFACRKEELYTSTGVRLSFSTDTVLFDTVFTDIGSTTRQFKVYNTYEQKIKISSIYLAKGESSNFRLNIDGEATNKVSNVQLESGDSIFIFVEVTVDPNRDEMIEQDSIVFITNGVMQDMDLVAFGQDVNLLIGDTIKENTIWNCEKPFLVYYYFMVDTLVILTIEKCTKIYFHHNGIMYVKGNVIVNGTKDEPVVFQGDRLEYMYDDIPGQWDRIVFAPGSFGDFTYAEVKNGIIGIQVGMLTGGATFRMHNCRIENMNYSGLFTIASWVRGYNCVIANCGFYNMAFLAGGDYAFYHCTSANYWGWANRTSPSILISDNLIANGTQYIGSLDTAYFGNCIIYGSGETEIELGQSGSATFEYWFDHCLLKTDNSIPTNDTLRFINPILNEPPGFIMQSEHNYQLDTLSASKDKGDPKLVLQNNYFLEKDFNGESRYPLPDIGAFERIE